MRIKNLIISFLFVTISMFIFTGCQNEVKYTINFLVDNKNYEVVTISGDEEVSLPENPAKFGYDFAGWYLDNNDWEQIFNAEQKIEDLQLPTTFNLYAKFTPIVFNITYHLNDGTLEEADNTFTIEQLPYTLPTPRKDGCIFDGWIDNETHQFIYEISNDLRNYELSAEWISIDELQNTCTFENKTYTYDGTIKVLEAQNVPENIHVQYSKNWLRDAGELNVTAEFFYKGNLLFDKTAKLTIEKATYDMSNVTFNDAIYEYDGTQKYIVISGTLPGWVRVSYVNNYRTTVGVSDAVAIFKGEDNYNDIPDMRARLIINKATPTLNASCLEEITTSTTAPLVANDASCDGSIALDAGQELVVGTNNYNWTFTPVDTHNYEIVTGTISLSVKATINFYNETNIFDSMITDKGGLATQPTATPTKAEIDGYYFVFEFWSEQPNGIPYDFNTEVQDDLNLYAVYSKCKKEYTIEYNLNNGNLGDENPTTYNITTENFTLNNPTKANCIFLGWTGSNGDEPQINVVIEKGSTGNKTYTANWYIIDKYLVIEDGTITRLTTAGKNLQTLIIPKNVTTIGYSALSEGAFTNVVFEENTQLATIDKHAFLSCENLESITIPSTVTSIDNTAFYGCSNLSMISVDKNNTVYDSRDNCSAIIETATNKLLLATVNTIIPYDIKIIGSYSFINCANIKRIILPDSLKYVEDSAFSGLTGNSLFIHYNNAFYLGNSNNPYMLLMKYSVRNITDCTIHADTKFIYSRAFYYCEELQTVTMQGTKIEVIGSEAFSGCFNLESIELEKLTNLKQIDYQAFSNCTSLQSVIIPNNLELMGANVFKGCNSLEEISLPFTGDKPSNTENKKIDYIFSPYNPTQANNTLPVSLKTVTITGNYPIRSGSFTGCGSLDKIVVTNNVPEIELGAFSNCTGLKEISLPFIGRNATIINKPYTHLGYIFGATSSTQNSTYVPETLSTLLFTGENIAAYSFRDCPNIKRIIIDNNVKYFSQGVFSGCSGLVELSVPFIGENTNIEYSMNKLDLMFIGVPATLKTVNITGDTTFIPESAFHVTIGTNNIETITMPETITSIGDYAFCSCANLTSVNIPNSVTSIGERAFDSCSSLTSINIPNNLEFLDSYAFESCTQLNYTEYNNGKYLGSSDNPYLIYISIIDKDATSASIHSNTKFIHSRAFYNCSALENVEIPNGIISIGASAFNDCSSLNNVELPNTLQILGESAFASCESLTNIQIPNSITEIAEYAFYSCDNLQNVTLSTGIISIGDFAFASCHKLQTISIPNTVKYIGCSAFTDCNKLNYTYYNSGCYIGNDENWNMVLVKISDTNITNFTAHTNTKFIGSYAFRNCLNLTTVVLPDNLIGICGQAFYNCTNLTNINIPNTIEYIDQYAFYNCTGLEDITIPSSVTDISYSAFEGCTGLTSITIPNSVKNINHSVFYNCTNLESVTIPNSIKYIYSKAFANCTSLTRIRFLGTKAEWRLITKYSDWNTDSGSYIVYCNDGNINK